MMLQMDLSRHLNFPQLEWSFQNVHHFIPGFSADSRTSTTFQQEQLASLLLETDWRSCCSEWGNSLGAAASTPLRTALLWCRGKGKIFSWRSFKANLTTQTFIQFSLLNGFVTANGEESIKPFRHIVQVSLLGVQDTAICAMSNQ